MCTLLLLNFWFTFLSGNNFLVEAKSQTKINPYSEFYTRVDLPKISSVRFNFNIISKSSRFKVDTLGFRIDNFNDYIALPSNLGGGGKLKGRASLQLLIDEKGKLVDVYIIQLNLKKGITPYLSFEKDRSKIIEDIIYPKKVSRYYPFFFNYVQKNFKFLKTGNAIEKVNMIYIPIRLY